MDTWNQISITLSYLSHELVVLGGDFNASLESSDKIGGRVGITVSQLSFQIFIFNNGLREVKTMNEGSYTWSNRRISRDHIAENLDRYFLRGNWATKPLLFEANVLSLAGSDHFPIEILICLDCAPIRCPFKFEKIWSMDPTLKEFDASTWRKAPVRPSSEAFIFFKKLQYLKGKLKEWNIIKFGNIFDNRNKVEAELKDLECSILNHGITMEAFNKEKTLKLKLNEILAREEVYWKKKSREGWLKEGDKNTIFFHNSVKVRRSWNKVTSIKNRNNEVLNELEEINKEVVDFFIELLSKNQDLDSQH
ncbi:uncharacterized protein LOC131860384 [Cryptomeria japonica]|uniref:uncharacterized protein LOC131860384 n=1 Tax=Cryptomeria japonica TaxID=3369 RepID=UPI0027DA8B35|nr:uncharacterized protein LOC131860384 [Cryptomeria japonica]